MFAVAIGAVLVPVLEDKPVHISKTKELMNQTAQGSKVWREEARVLMVIKDIQDPFNRDLA